MTGRERIIKSLSHQRTDRIPIDLGGGACGIHEEAYKRLIKHLKMNGDVECYDHWQRLACIDEKILQMFNVDTRYIFVPSDWVFHEDENGVVTDEWGIKRKRCGYYYEVIPEESPLKSGEISSIHAHTFPNPKSVKHLEIFKRTVTSMYNSTEYALVLGNVGGVLQGSPVSDLVGWERYLTYIYLKPDFIVELIEYFYQWWYEFFDGVLSYCGKYIDVVWLGDDWGTQNGPLMNPDLFRSMYKPRYKKLIQFIKSKADVKIVLHSCGSIRWAIEDFIEIGVDAINPVQVAAKGMNTRELKRDFGDRISFWGGGIDTQRILPFGTVEEVQIEVKQRIRDLAQDGGFVFAPVHNILAEVPAVNILTMFETAGESKNP
jgi:uroporphyrinogen decarboxylase